MQRTTHLIIFCSLALILANACKKSNAPKTISYEMAGTKIWHGTHTFSGVTDTIVNDTMTITTLNDSQVITSNMTSLPLTFKYIDSVNKFAFFLCAGAPPTLYYYYTTGALHYSLHNGGIHDEDFELYTP